MKIIEDTDELFVNEINNNKIKAKNENKKIDNKIKNTNKNNSNNKYNTNKKTKYYNKNKKNPNGLIVKPLYKKQNKQNINKKTEDKIENNINKNVNKNNESLGTKNKKIKKEKIKLTKKEKLFCIINTLIIFIIIIFYAGRTIYYYIDSHKINEKTKLIEVLTNINNISVKGDGLYKIGDNYIYRGNKVNNYLNYNGNLWRIINIDDGIKIILEDSLTINNYGLETNYETSKINKYLQEYIINNYKLYQLKEMRLLDKAIDEDNDNYYNTKISLLTKQEYINSGDNSYLNNNTNFYIFDYKLDKSLNYINKDGNIKTCEDEFISIRPVIMLDTDTLYFSGNGTKTNPYIIEEDNYNTLEEYPLGSYIEYNNEIYRIINKDKDSIELILKENTIDKIEFNNIEKYLNNDYIKKYNKEELLLNKYSIDHYKNDKINDKQNYIILGSVGTLYLNSIDNTWLYNIDKTTSLALTLTKYNTLFGDYTSSLNTIQPIIKIKNNYKVYGKGYINDVIKIEVENEEN